MKTAARIVELTTDAVRDFRNALANPIAAQHRVLQRILHDNQYSVFGQQYGFARIATAAEFAQSVPIGDYESFRHAIERIATGEQGLLSGSLVCQFEETGGSTAGAKLIPYTVPLLHAFQRGVQAWLGNLAVNRPQAFSGSLYFVISPVARRIHHTTGGIPIGHGNDLAYLGEDLAQLLQAQTLFQPELCEMQTSAQWQIRTATLLAQHENLSLISVWSPTLLLQLIHTLQHEQDHILPHIADTARRQTLAKALSGSQPDTHAIWQQLDTISCWDSHTAAAPADELRALLPQVYIQGKGLLATEGISTIPFSGCLLPALNSHFYEFIDENQCIFLLHELEYGKTYRLILTTQGGLYRYDTHDWVVAEQSDVLGVPALRFIGRGNVFSDLCGEKLHESFVAQALRNVGGHQVSGSLFVQGVVADVPYYTLLAAPETVLPDGFTQRLEKALRANPQYDYARQINQLGELKLFRQPEVVAYVSQWANSRMLGVQKLPLLLPVKCE